MILLWMLFGLWSIHFICITFLCQVFIKLIPIFKISQAVRALKWYWPCIHFAKVFNLHWNNGWNISLTLVWSGNQRIINKFKKQGSRLCQPPWLLVLSVMQLFRLETFTYETQLLILLLILLILYLLYFYWQPMGCSLWECSVRVLKL